MSPPRDLWHGGGIQSPMRNCSGSARLSHSAIIQSFSLNPHKSPPLPPERWIPVRREDLTTMLGDGGWLTTQTPRLLVLSLIRLGVYQRMGKGGHRGYISPGAELGHRSGPYPDS
jgi:hypothetical protein